ncbi:MAG: calcium-binding protein [Pseudooceanicola atlanticus]
MTQVDLGQGALVSGAGKTTFRGIVDLLIMDHDTGPLVYATTRAGGEGITVHGVANGRFAQADHVAFTGDDIAGAVTRLVPLELGTASWMAVTGLDDRAGLHGWAIDGAIDGAGHLGSKALQPGGATLPADLTFAEQLTVRGQDFLYTVEGGREIRRWSIDEAGQISGGSGQNSQLSAYHGGLVDMDGFALNGAGHLLALSGGEVQLGSYSPSRDGRLRMRDQVEQADGIGISQPSALEVAELAGRYYAIVAARGSSSLSVIEVAADGTLIPRDHLLDSTETRFGTAAHIAVAARGDQVFVAAAGSEPGLSLFQLLPGGRLLHLDTLADHAGITLADISALDMLARADGSLGIAVASETEAGVTWLDVATGPQGQLILGGTGSNDLQGTDRDDLISGGDAGETLSGGQGDDILSDGAGSDRLTGGKGRDIFVMTGDGERDIIHDFDPEADSLDLSDWTFLRSAAQLTVLTKSYGADILFGDEVLQLETVGRTSLDQGEIQSLNLLNVDRLSPEWMARITAPRDDTSGTDGPDTLVGGGDADHLEGGKGDDRLEAGDGDDTLDGGTGADTLVGGAGNDMHIVTDAGDVVIEGKEEGGADHVFSAVDFNMAGIYVEHLTLTGTGNTMGIGNGLINVLTGNSGNNTLDGAGGPDTLIGGLGDDFYVTRTPYEIVIENPGEGIDWIRSYDTIWLPHNVEHMELRGGTSDFNGVGNDFDNIMLGNDGRNVLVAHAGDDTLDGRGGADRLEGGPGSDFYVVDNPGDIVLESGRHAGHDIVRSSIDYIMSKTADIEEIRLTGDARIGIANNMENIVIGNSRDNIIDGGGNNDVMEGGNGNDLYIVNAPVDVVIEAKDGGTDTIRAYRSLKLPDNVENLEMRSSNPFTAVGNTLDNVLSATSGNNTLIGREGNDTLYGLDGADTFVFDRAPGADNFDSLPDFDRGEGDQIWLRSTLAGDLAPGALSGRAFHLGSAAADAADRLIYDQKSGVLWFDPDGTGAQQAVALADLHGAALSAADILIV